MDIVNIAGYKFVDLHEFRSWREPIATRCRELSLRGTILLSSEGINLFLAGSAAAIDAVLEFLTGDARFGGSFADLEVKRSLSERQPFRRMLVRLKKEIITMGCAHIRPAAGRAPAVGAATLARWLNAGHDDEGRAVALLDTRNEFEIALGSFDGAHSLRIDHFSEFADAARQFVAQPSLDLEKTTVVTFCTGGIRCEKAALLLQELAVPHVAQLDGGILKYFEQVGAAHYHGDCFVFDDRVALNDRLSETATTQCYACRSVVTQNEQSDVRYVRGKSCPHCAPVSGAP